MSCPSVYFVTEAPNGKNQFATRRGTQGVSTSWEGGLPGGLVLVIGILWVLWVLWVLWGDILWISGLCPARFLFLLVGLIAGPSLALHF